MTEAQTKKTRAKCLFVSGYLKYPFGDCLSILSVALVLIMLQQRSANLPVKRRLIIKHMSKQAEKSGHLFVSLPPPPHLISSL